MDRWQDLLVAHIAAPRSGSRSRTVGLMFRPEPSSYLEKSKSGATTMETTHLGTLMCSKDVKIYVLVRTLPHCRPWFELMSVFWSFFTGKREEDGLTFRDLEAEVDGMDKTCMCVGMSVEWALDHISTWYQKGLRCGDIISRAEYEAREEARNRDIVWEREELTSDEEMPQVEEVVDRMEESSVATESCPSDPDYEDMDYTSSSSVDSGYGSDPLDLD